MASVKGHRGRKFQDKLDCPLELANVEKGDVSLLENFYANKLGHGTVICDLDMRDLLTEGLLRDKMCRFLYNAFFGGGHFFGLGIPKDMEMFLDGIFDTIQTEGEYLAWITVTGLSDLSTLLDEQRGCRLPKPGVRSLPLPF